MNRRTSATAVSVLLLLLAACGGHSSGGTGPADAGHAASTSTPVPRRTMPSATPTTQAPGHDEVEAQVKQALVAAHAPGNGSYESRGCAIGYETLDVGRHYPHFRRDVVAALHASGWKTGPGGGPEETALTNAAGWQAFVEQRDVGKINGTGSPTRELMVTAHCT